MVAEKKVDPASGGRNREIAEILARHGLGFLSGQLGIQRWIPFHKGFLGHPRRPEPYTSPEHIRMALEDLGPAFVKLGQMLSTRTDLIPAEYQLELAKLQDQVPPIPPEQAIAAIEEELHKPVAELFSWFDPAPIAAGSIGQVHRARMHDGSDVVVKVRRPGVVESIEEDLVVIQSLARSATRHWDVAQNYDLVGLTAEFATVIRSELDYVREGRNVERFAESFKSWPAIRIPRVYWETSTRRVLTLELIEGIKPTDAEGLAKAGVSTHEVALTAANAILKMVFEDGLFHADPHPGNFFIEPSGRLGLIDFGMVGTVDDNTQQLLIDLIVGVGSKDSQRLVDSFLALGTAREHVDRDALGAELSELVSAYYDRPLSAIPVGEIINRALAIARQYRLALPTDLALLLKTFVMAEGVASGIDPGFEMAAVLRPYAERLVAKRLLPGYWAKRLGSAGESAFELATRSPRQLTRLLSELERGGLEFGLRPVGVEPLMNRLETLANRIVMAVITAAFIVGLSILMSFYHPAGWQAWIAVVFALGFAAAAGLGLYLAWGIVRGTR